MLARINAKTASKRTLICECSMLTYSTNEKQTSAWKPIIKILRLRGLSWLLCVLSCPCAWGITVTNEAKPMCSYCWLKTKSKTPWCWLCLHPIFDSLQKAHLSEFQKCVQSVKYSNCVLLWSCFLVSVILFFAHKMATVQYILGITLFVACFVAIESFSWKTVMIRLWYTADDGWSLNGRKPFYLAVWSDWIHCL